MVEVRGIPDRSSVPSAFLNYQTVSRISDPGSTDENWNFVAQFHPNPVNFGWWTKVDSDEVGTSAFFPVLNTQLTGDNIGAKSLAWADKCERWRLAYAGVTVHFDGAALTNQGTLVASQVPYAPRTRTLSAKNTDGVYTTWPEVMFPDGTSSPSWSRGRDFPSFASSEQLPNSYMGAAKEGVYIPLKLTKTCQQWHSSSDRVAWSKSYTPAAYTNECIMLPSVLMNLDYPHPGLPCAFMNSVGTANIATLMPVNGSDVVANLCGRNIAHTSAFVLEFRYGFEVQCEPGTDLSPFLRISPQYDSAALKAYAMVSRELKDGYPADYNDLGKLWSVIRQIASAIGPSLAFIPKFGPFLSGAASIIGSTKAPQQSATELDRERSEVRKMLVSDERKAVSRRPASKAKRPLQVVKKTRRTNEVGTRL